MRLDITDRLLFNGNLVLPTEGSHADLTLAQALHKAFAFTDDEVKRWSLRTDGACPEHPGAPGNWHWHTEIPDPDAQVPAIGDPDERPRLPLDTTADFNLGARGIAMLVAGLKRLDAEGRLPSFALATFDKFVTEPARLAEAERTEAEEQTEAEVAALRPRPALEVVPPTSEYDEVAHDMDATSARVRDEVVAPV